MRYFKYSPFSFDFNQVLLTATIRHIFPETDDARIAPHLFPQGGVDEVHHRFWLAARGRRRIELCRGWIYGVRIQVRERARWRRRLGAQYFFAGVLDLFIDLMGNALQGMAVKYAFAD